MSSSGRWLWQLHWVYRWPFHINFHSPTLTDLKLLDEELPASEINTETLTWKETLKGESAPWCLVEYIAFLPTQKQQHAVLTGVGIYYGYRFPYLTTMLQLKAITLIFQKIMHTWTYNLGMHCFYHVSLWKSWHGIKSERHFKDSIRLLLAEAVVFQDMEYFGGRIWIRGFYVALFLLWRPRAVQGQKLFIITPNNLVKLFLITATLTVQEPCFWNKP